jgi:hypothetical protein
MKESKCSCFLFISASLLGLLLTQQAAHYLGLLSEQRRGHIAISWIASSKELTGQYEQEVPVMNSQFLKFKSVNSKLFKNQLTLAQKRRRSRLSAKHENTRRRMLERQVHLDLQLRTPCVGFEPACFLGVLCVSGEQSERA